MLKNIWWSSVVVLFVALVSPLFIYWWGVSNLEKHLAPSDTVLHSDRELEIWRQVGESGEPEIKPVSVYGYIVYLSCQFSQGLYAADCVKEYPGLALATLAIRDQVAKQYKDEGNLAFQVTWAANSVWVTSNWDIHQILATYDDAYGESQSEVAE